jgi:hypothetical protein
MKTERIKNKNLLRENQIKNQIKNQTENQARKPNNNKSEKISNLRIPERSMTIWKSQMKK